MMVRQSQTNDLCELQDVKDYLFRGGGNQTSTDDNLLQRLITAASEWIRQETSRHFEAGNYTEVRSGQGGRILFFRNPPANSVSSLYVDGNAIPARNANVTAYGENGYAFDENKIFLTGYSFNRGVMNVQMTYAIANNTTFPDLEEVCIEAVSWAYREIDRLGMISKVLAGEQVNFNLDAMSKRSRKILDHYRSPIPKI
jgi:hypothetical protein